MCHVRMHACQHLPWICLMACCAAGYHAAAYTFWGDDNWDNWGNANPDLEVLAIAHDPSSGAVYAGGRFTSIGGIQATGVAMWTGTVWTNLGSGLWDSGTVPDVEALAVDAQGNMYAAGNFDTAGGSTVRDIAKWNGTTWSRLGNNGPDGIFRALTVDSYGNVFVSGSHGPEPGFKIGKWDGNAWTFFGTLPSSVYIEAMAVDEEDHLYVGGSFTNIGSVAVNRVAMWDGASWHALGSGMANGEVHALVLAGNGALYAAGTFTQAGGISANYIAMWNGSVWTNLRSGTEWYVHALALSSIGYVVAGGEFARADGLYVRNVAVWNGATWTNLGSGIESGHVYALDIDAGNNLYVGGTFSYAGGKTANKAARYQGIPEPGAWGLLALFTIYKLQFTMWRKQRRGRGEE